MAKASFLAGIFKGLGSFLQGLISDQGLSVSYLFAVGALAFAGTFRIIEAVKLKMQTGSFYDIEQSNFIKDRKIKWINVLGLFLRAGLNKGFQVLCVYAFMYAEKASLNQGIITALLSTYCIFTSIIFLAVFNERLQTKFLVGIILMMSCVFLVALPSGGDKLSLTLEQLYYSRLAIALSIVISVVISLFILVSRYWTEKYGYNTVDYNVDSIMLMGLAEIGFYIRH